MPTTPRTPRRVLLTGATDGIGLALARLYAGAGAELVLVGRRPLQQLDASLFTPRNYCRADLATDVAVETVAGFLEAQGLNKIDVAIFNAGIGWVGNLRDQTPALIEESNSGARLSSRKSPFCFSLP